MCNKVKNILFDLGGVILNLDVEKTIKAFDDLGISDVVNSTGHHYTNNKFYDFEKGGISENEFLEFLQKRANKNANVKTIYNAWNAMLLGIPKARVELLQKIRKGYNIFLLSNTNCIHQKKFTADFKLSFGFSFENLFDNVHYSYEMGMRKPDIQAFEFVIKNNGINPKETLFVDDSIHNVQSAQKTGMSIFHVKDYNLMDILNDYKLNV